MAVKALSLKHGDTIGIVAPSWCGPAKYPKRVHRGVEFLESLGFHVVLGSNTFGERGVVSGTPAERVADIHEMFGNKEIRAVIAAIGGSHSCHLLPFLDWDLIGRNPKIFMGFSDITVLNLAIYKSASLHTFNGPMIMTDFGEEPRPIPYTIDHALQVLCQSDPLGQIKPSAKWTDDFLHWATDEIQTKPRELITNTGWVWLKKGKGSGRLIGGCIESMEHLRGTPYWPDLEGALLFLETSEEAPTPMFIDAILQDYENMGVFSQIVGLLVGRPSGYTVQQREEFRHILLERTRRYSFPIVSDMDFGHTAPMFTLPIGCEAAIDDDGKRFLITEAAVTDSPLNSDWSK